MNSYSNELEGIQSIIWHELQCAVSNRQHGWRTMTLASLSCDGLPDARTVVLREVDPVEQQLAIYTDKRSPKILQMTQHPNVSLVFWCSKLNWQLRIQAIANTCHDPERALRVWQHVRDTAGAQDYLSLQAPSSPIKEDGRLCEDKNQLCIINFNIQSIDWLSLSREGHRRAKIENGQLTWLTP
ncbi:pyridoxamine 5'-phosphate oxidase family protein [Nitrincola schmidtii]|uniref:pyridoxamine 5'-phosphate oxidase family protein n=1 Tax=Nitrincola schmidtii TaxID=1730894 RepID=UPI00124F1791|nr:pyridoxamine 5'-phosphate oxidase family protein [Nitrincola schmidtii]